MSVAAVDTGRREIEAIALVGFGHGVSHFFHLMIPPLFPWLIAEFERNGLRFVRRRAGQFTEIYTILPWRWLRRIVHSFNHAWFRWVRRGGPAFGNLLVFVRPASG